MIAYTYTIEDENFKDNEIYDFLSQVGGVVWYEDFMIIGAKKSEDTIVFFAKDRFGCDCRLVKG